MKQTATQKIINWFDSYAVDPQQQADDVNAAAAEQLNWLRVLPFFLMHLACLAVIWVGWSPVAVLVAIGFYALRVVGITAFYHRYFSHKTFKTSRIAQFIFALIGAAATQRGPLWWASHHRHHHYYSDTDDDVHSPRKGVWWSHMGWFLADKHFRTRHDLIPDFARFKELVVLDRFDLIVPLACMAFMYCLGALLENFAPSLGTTGAQMFVWGYLISTVAVLHATLCINSLAHRVGSRRFNTSDTSRNNWFLALITFGEGWHNNHHRFPNSARQGLRWWELDISYYLLKIMEKLGIIWNLNTGPSAEQIQRAIAQSVTPSATQKV